MKFSKLKRYDAIEIIWIDSWSPIATGWTTDHEQGSMRVRTVAIYYDQNKDYIYTYGSVSISDEFSTLLANAFNIPKACIKEIRKLI